MKSKLLKIGLALSAVATGCLLYGFCIEPRMLKVRYVSVSSPNWSGEPLTIGLITDIHIGGLHVDADRVKHITERMNRVSPDIVLLPGDFVNGHKPLPQRSGAQNAQISQGLAALGALKAPLGVFASIGNHDAWYSAQAVTQQLTGAGITVLENAASVLDDRLCIVGLEDDFTGSPNAKAFERCQQAAIISLMHSPDSFHLVPHHSILSVAGHTHGGQINLPIIGRRVTSTRLGKDYAYGLIKDTRSPLFVSAGVGTSILPARFRAPPEIVVLSLQGR